MIGRLGPTEILILLALVLLLFGSRKIGQLGKDLGEGIRGFKQSVRGDQKPPDEASGK